MNEEKLNNMLKAQITAQTPDILDELMRELPEAQAEGTQVPDYDGSEVIAGRRRAKPTSYLLRTIVAAAALLAVFFAGRMFGLRGAGSSSAGAHAGPVTASITLDVNPSVELQIDKEERVASCRGLNKEGEEILSEMNLTGSDVAVASYAVLGKMMVNGYLTGETNSVLVSVLSDEKKVGDEIEKHLTKDIHAYLENSSIGAAIIGQYISDDEKLHAFAQDNGISEGKAWIIRQLAGTSERLTEESLLKLTTQELMLLWDERGTGAGEKADSSGTSHYGSVSTSGYVAKRKAVDVALSHIGITRQQAQDVEVEFDCEDGVIIYEVGFTFDGREYEVDIQASTGTVIGGGPGQSSILEGQPDTDDDNDSDDDDDRYEGSGDDDADDAVDDRYEEPDDDDESDDRDDGDHSAEQEDD